MTKTAFSFVTAAPEHTNTARARCQKRRLAKQEKLAHADTEEAHS